MKKKTLNGILTSGFGSLWWGVIGVLYFKFVSFASPLELTIHRTIWTALLLVITTSYYSKWSEFNKIINKRINIFILLIFNLFFGLIYTYFSRKILFIRQSDYTGGGQDLNNNFLGGNWVTPIYNYNSLFKYKSEKFDILIKKKL